MKRYYNSNENKVKEEELITAGKLVTHDVKSKLTPCYLAIALIREKIQTTKISKELNIIKSSCKAIERIVTNYEAIVYGEELDYKKVNELFKKAVSRFAELQERKIKVIYECQKLKVLADSRLIPVFSNLIDNSLKYAKGLSKIRLYYSKESNGLELIYEDNGEGIPEEEKEKIFNEGYGEGTGRGLYLVRKILESYGWTIKENGREGEGVKFTIFIPKPNPRIKPIRKI